jgi:hypothetical protein
MKTLVTIAALIAGVAVANAQSNPQSNNMKATSSGTAAWCLQDTGSSTQLSCKFASQADCQKEAKGKGTCIQNTGTTGAGGSMKSDKKQ